MATEQVILGDIDLNDQVTWSIRGDSFVFTPAKKKLNWATSAMGDGASLIGDEDHYENAELTFVVRAKPQGSKDAALSTLNELTQTLQDARRQQGRLPLIWGPAGSAEALTFYVIDAEYDEIHTSKEGGWFDHQPEVAVHLYLRPFGYGSEILQPLGWSDQFIWDGITGGRWRFDQGSGTIAVSSGSLTPSDATVKRMFLPFTTTDATVTMRVKVGATTTGQTGVILKRLNNTGGTPPATGNYLKLAIDGDVNLVRIRKVVNGTPTTVGTSGAFTPTASTFYWLQVSILGDELSASVYSDAQNPLETDDPTPLASASATDATFGEGIEGNIGIYHDPAGTGSEWLITDYIARDMPQVKSAEPMAIFEVPGVGGHVPAEARQVVTEEGNKGQSHYEWGLEAGDYVSGTPLILDSAVLDPTGLSGAQGTGTGAYDPDATGTNLILSDALSTTAAVKILNTNAQLHVGTYKVKARVRDYLNLGLGGIRVRLAWQVGVTPLVRNDYAPPLRADWQEIDLGTITIPQAALGDQNWSARIEAFSPLASGARLLVDYLMLIPLERYGVARAPIRPLVPDVFAQLDGFTQGTPGTFHGAVMDIGGPWSAAGASGFSIDFATNHWLQRSLLTDASLKAGAFGLASATNYINAQVQADIRYSATTVTSNNTSSVRTGVVARYNGLSDWLMAVVEGGSTLTYLRVYKCTTAGGSPAGTPVLLGSLTVANSTQLEWRTISLRVDDAGTWSVWRYKAGTKQPATPPLTGQDSDLATAGPLATGRVGVFDANTSSPASTRQIDQFQAFANTPDYVMYANGNLEVRSDRAERSGTNPAIYGRVPQYRGERFYLPAAGDVGYVSRMIAKDRRLNVDEGQPDSTPFTDALTIAIFASPRYLHPVGR